VHYPMDRPRVIAIPAPLGLELIQISTSLCKVVV
jgi:hypothetical protein